MAAVIIGYAVLALTAIALGIWGLILRRRLRREERARIKAEAAKEYARVEVTRSMLTRKLQAHLHRTKQAT